LVESSEKPAKLTYTAERCLGFGGQAKVYSVTVDEPPVEQVKACGDTQAPKSPKRLALKLYESGYTEMAQQEYAVLQKVADHPNIV